MGCWIVALRATTCRCICIGIHRKVLLKWPRADVYLIKSSGRRECETVMPSSGSNFARRRSLAFQVLNNAFRLNKQSKAPHTFEPPSLKCKPGPFCTPIGLALTQNNYVGPNCGFSLHGNRKNDLPFFATAPLLTLRNPYCRADPSSLGNRNRRSVRTAWECNRAGLPFRLYLLRRTALRGFVFLEQVYIKFFPLRVSQKRRTGGN